MKKVLLLTMALLVVSSMAFAQAGYLGIYDTPDGGNCDLVNIPVNVATFYVVHHATVSTGAQWMAENLNPSLLLLTSAVNPAFVSVGDPATGVSVGYGGCLRGPIHVYTLTYFNQAFETCIPLSIVADPLAISGKIEVYDCAFNMHVANGETSYLNGDGSCPCLIPLPTEETSWGRVKALYDE